MGTQAPQRKSGKRARRIVAALALGAIAATLPAVPASATYLSGGMPSRSFNYKTHGVNSWWVASFDTGNIRWNQRVSSSIGRSTSAKADATAGSYSQSWYGLYTPHGVRNLNRTFSIKINSRTLSRDSTDFQKWVWSTTTHELGHSLSLADDPNTSSASIMKHSRNRTTSQFPTAYDISEVNRIY